MSASHMTLTHQQQESHEIRPAGHETLAQGAAHLSIAGLGEDGHAAAAAVGHGAGRRDADAVVAVIDTVTTVDDGRKIDGTMVILRDTTTGMTTVGGATGGTMNGEEAATMTTAVAGTTSVKRPERRS